VAKKKARNGGGDQEPQAQEQNGHSGGTRKPPVHEVRIGRIRATVWENIDDQGNPWYSVTFSRSYKQGDEWKTASSYGRDDLLVVAEVARLAFLFVAAQVITVTKPLPTDKPPEDIPI
jgi:hypothetical protein